MTKYLPTLTLLVVALLAAAPVFSQNAPRTDCQRLLDEAAVFEKNKQYDRALRKYLSAKEECEAATAAKVNDLILKVFDKIQKQKKEADEAKEAADRSAAAARNSEAKAKLAQAKAEHSSKANQLAALALSETERDPTLALQLAAMAWLNAADSVSGFSTEPGVSAVLRDIASDPTAWFSLSLKGHQRAVRSVAFSPNGTTLATASDDETVRLWDIQGKPLDTLLGHTQAVRLVTYSPNGELLLTFAADSTARLWTRQGKAVHTFQHGSWLSSAAFSPNGRYVLTTCDSTVALWNVRTGERAYTWKSGQGERIESADFSPYSDRVLTVSAGKVMLWDSTGVFKGTLFQGIEVAKALFDPGGTYVIASNAQAVYRVSLASLAVVDSLSVEMGTGDDIVISDNGLRVFGNSTYGGAWYCDVADFKKIYRMVGGKYFEGFASPYGKEWAVFTAESVTLWKGPSGQSTSLNGHKGNVGCASFSPNEQFVLTGSEDGTARLWFEGSNFPHHNPEWTRKYSTRLEVSPDQKKMLVSAWQGAVLFDFETRTTRDLDVRLAQAAAFSPDGSLMAAVSALDSSLRIFDSRGTVLRQLRLPVLPEQIGRLAFSPSNRRLVLSLGDNQRLMLLDPLDGAAYAVPTRHPKDVYFAWSPDGSRLLTWGFEDTLAYLWDERGALLRTLQGHKSAIATAQFFPGGSRIVTSSVGGSAFWTYDGQLLGKFSGQGVSIAPDGKRFLMLQSNAAAVLYDADGRLLRPLPMPDEAYKRAEFFFTPDSKSIVAVRGSGDDSHTAFWSAQGEYLFETEGIFLSPNGADDNPIGGYFFPNGDFITLLLKGDKTLLRQWRREGSGVKLVRIYEGLDGGSAGAAVSPDGRFVLAYDNTKVLVWEANGTAGTLFRTIRPGGNVRYISRASFLPNSQHVLALVEPGIPHIWAVGKAFAAQCQLLDKADLLKAGAGVSIEEVLGFANSADLEEMARYYFDLNDWENARRFYARLEEVQHIPFTLQKLYEIGERIGSPYGTSPFYQAASFDERLSHADFFYRKKQWLIAHDLYEKAEPMQPSARCLNQLHRLADTLRQPFDLSRYDRLDGNFNELYGAANYFYERDGNRPFAKQLHEKALAIEYDLLLMYQLYQMCLADGTPFDTTRFLATDRPGHLSTAGSRFFRERRWEMARQLYEKAESLEHSTENLYHLLTIADSTGQAFDFSRLLRTDDVNELQDYIYRFENQENWGRMRQVLERMEAMEHNASNLIQLYSLSLRDKQPFEFSRMLRSNDPNELREYGAQISYIRPDSMRSYVPFGHQAVQLGEKLLLLDTAQANRWGLANTYNNLGFALLFVPSPAEAEKALLRAKALQPDLPVTYTNLPIAILMQGRFVEAKTIYLEYVDKPYRKHTYRETFLADLDDLEKQGVTYPDFEKVRKLLRK